MRTCAANGVNPLHTGYWHAVAGMERSHRGRRKVVGYRKTSGMEADMWSLVHGAEAERTEAREPDWFSDITAAVTTWGSKQQAPS
jgi:hypothetical protein